MPGLHIDDHMTNAPQAPLNVCTNHVFMQIHAIDGVISSDQTGRFPITSNRGNAYVVVFYIYDANYIRTVPIKSRLKEELLRAYHEVYEWLALRGFKPLLHKMDNETSHEVEKFIHGQQTHLQYTPPDMHRTNPAERAIRTWKNHFLVGITGLPKSFPIANWCRLTKQCDTTLNMLRPCQQNPLLSAHEALEGSILLFRCYAHGAPQHGGSCAHETQPTQHLGIPCLKSLVSFPFAQPLPLHPSFNGRHWW